MPGALLHALGSVAGLFFFGSSAHVEGTLYARLREEVGWAPPAPDADPELALGTDFSPGGVVEFRTPRSTLAVGYAPRLYYRTPNLLGLDRPLLLHRGTATYGLNVSETVNYSLSAAISYGEVDYTSARLAFNNTVIARDVDDSVIKTFAYDAQTGFAFRWTQRFTLGVAASAARTQPVGIESETAFPQTMIFGLTVAPAYDLDPVSTLSFPVEPRYYVVSPGADLMSTSANVRYGRRLSLRTTVNALTGVIVAKAAGDSTQAFPRAFLGYEQLLLQRPGSTLSNNASIGLDASLDQTTGEIQPGLTVQSQLRSDFGADWMATLMLEGTASTTSTLAPGVEAEAFAESTFAASTLIGYRLSDDVRLEGGVRYSTRATNVFEGDVEFRDEQIWGFFGITAAFGIGSTQRGGAWAL